MKRTKKGLAAFVCALLLALPGSAMAADPGVSGYEDNGSQVQGVVQDDSGGGGGGTETASGGSLPFTGAELGVLAGAGGLLVLMGFGLRRLTHRPTGA